MKTHFGWPVAVLMALSLAVVMDHAQALEQIIRPYQNARSSGMGGVRLTTGLYDENFFGNPARVTDNPRFRLSLLEPTFEVGNTAIQTADDILGGSGDTLEKLGDTAGRNNHLRFQTVFPSLYLPTNAGARMAYAFGLIANVQGDVALRRNFAVSPRGAVDVGPAVTVGRRFLADDSLSVGMTTHLIYRAASKEDVSLGDLLGDSSLSADTLGGEGAMVDFDLGTTYRLPWIWQDFDFLAGAAINNLLGGKYSNLDLRIRQDSPGALEQPRTFGFGISARRAVLGPFRNFLTALEFTDFGNNPDGSFFRTIHWGAEAHYGVLSPRIGLNQGYLTGGLGINFRYFSLDYAYFAEEMSLNAGGFEDRRHALKFAFQL